MTKRTFKYQVVEVPVANEGGAGWQIINLRRNAVVSTHETQGDAFREVQAILADEAHPNFYPEGR